MRKLVFTLFLALMALSATAQIETPAASPSAELETVIGLTEVEIDYSRPGMKGRQIFATDGLVPYGQIWRTGANQATKISFEDDVVVGGQELESGSYAILTKPSSSSWDVMFFPYESGSWSSYKEKSPTVIAKASVKRTSTPVETFTIDVNNYSADGADLVMSWGNTTATLPIKTNAKADVMENIDRVMAGPTMNDYYNAAAFLADNGQEDKALIYITKANDMAGDNARFWMVRRQGLIEQKLGKTMEARKSFQRSLELAEKAGNMDYVRMNKLSLGEL